jgi:hypothetical protein
MGHYVHFPGDTDPVRLVVFVALGLATAQALAELACWIDRHRSH